MAKSNVHEYIKIMSKRFGTQRFYRCKCGGTVGGNLWKSCDNPRCDFYDAYAMLRCGACDQLRVNCNGHTDAERDALSEYLIPVIEEFNQEKNPRKVRIKKNKEKKVKAEKEAKEAWEKAEKEAKEKEEKEKPPKDDTPPAPSGGEEPPPPSGGEEPPDNGNGKPPKDKGKK